mmetsp:Transcript_32975/g.92614  ORF Transcript_32975/g.92614 Transcript_32975/m.92614 type:complete len:255 (+) Transcript_32975:314-1078(+)
MTPRQRSSSKLRPSLILPRYTAKHSAPTPLRTAPTKASRASSSELAPRGSTTTSPFASWNRDQRGVVPLDAQRHAVVQASSALYEGRKQSTPAGMASRSSAMAPPSSARKFALLQLPKVLTMGCPLPGNLVTTAAWTCDCPITWPASRGPSGCARAEKAAEAASSALMARSGDMVPDASTTAWARAANVSKMIPEDISQTASVGEPPPAAAAAAPPSGLFTATTYASGCCTASLSFMSSSFRQSRTPRRTASSG